MLMMKMLAGLSRRTLRMILPVHGLILLDLVVNSNGIVSFECHRSHRV